MNERPKILISGAGIAGVSTAYWLHQRGFAPTVVERAPAPRPGGQAVDVRGAGRSVVERMGLTERVRAVAVEQRGILFVDARGREIARMSAEAFGGEGIVSEVEVLRGDLCRVLYEATVPNVEYRFGDAITSIDQDLDGVDVAFSKGPPGRFDLVVGADGVRSVVRSLAFGPDSQCVRPLNCYTAWFTAPTRFDVNGWFVMHNAPGGRVVSARPGRVAGEIKVGLSFRSEPLGNQRDGPGLFAEKFEGVGWQAPQLIEAMSSSTDFFWEWLGQVRLDRWTSGRVALVGDAGYCPTPLTGLGTSLALVGGYVLAGELANAGGDHHTAFQRYDQRMRPYVARSQQLPPGGVKAFAPTGATMIRLRALSMRAMTRWPARAVMARQFSKAADVELPAYDGAVAPLG